MRCRLAARERCVLLRQLPAGLPCSRSKPQSSVEALQCLIRPPRAPTFAGERAGAASSRRPAAPRPAKGAVSGFTPALQPVNSPSSDCLSAPSNHTLCHAAAATSCERPLDFRQQRGASDLARCDWPAHMEPLIPEGLQHKSVALLAYTVASSGFNLVRLTYSIDGVLQGKTTTLRQAMLAAGRRGNWSSVAEQYVADISVHNPGLVDATLDKVFAAVINELGAWGVMTLLDNHVSTAKWCCNPGDSNDYWWVRQGHQLPARCRD